MTTINIKTDNIKTGQKENQEVDLKLQKKTQNIQSNLVEKIWKITKISSEKVDEIVDKSENTKDIIYSIIKLDAWNIKLAELLFSIDVMEYYSAFNPLIFNDRKVLEMALGNSPEIMNFSIVKEPLFLALKDMKKSTKLLQIIFQNFIKQEKKLEIIEEFIQKISWWNSEKSKQLYQQYKILLLKAGNIVKNDLEKKAMNLMESKDTQAFSLMRKYTLLDEKWHINPVITQRLQKLISENINKKLLENTSESIINFLWKTIGLGQKDIQLSSVQSLLEWLYHSFSLTIKTEEISEKKIEWNKKIWEQENDNAIQTELSSENNTQEWDDVELLNFVNPNYSLYSSGENYEIKTGGDNVLFTKEDYKKLTQQSLENYIKFNSILQKTGLQFLFENKYKGDFLKFLRSELIWFNEISWEWFSDHHILGVLNTIGNLMWIPEKYYGETWELWKFDWLGKAISTFQYINATGIINGNKVAKSWWWWLVGNWASKVTFLAQDILGENGGFNIKKAETVLQENGYSN